MVCFFGPESVEVSYITADQTEGFETLVALPGLIPEPCKVLGMNRFLFEACMRTVKTVEIHRVLLTTTLVVDALEVGIPFSKGTLQGQAQFYSILPSLNVMTAQRLMRSCSSRPSSIKNGPHPKAAPLQTHRSLPDLLPTILNFIEAASLHWGPLAKETKQSYQKTATNFAAHSMLHPFGTTNAMPETKFEQ